jgi:hypothetical protein
MWFYLPFLALLDLGPSFWSLQQPKFSIMTTLIGHYIYSILTTRAWDRSVFTSTYLFEVVQYLVHGTWGPTTCRRRHSQTSSILELITLAFQSHDLGLKVARYIVDWLTAMSNLMDCTSLEHQLLELVGQIRSTDSDQSWHDVEASAQLLANGLRVRGGPGEDSDSPTYITPTLRFDTSSTVDNHTALGKTSLPQTLTSLLKLALHGSVIPDVAYSPAVFEVLRVAANLCMDHGKLC